MRKANQRPPKPDGYIPLHDTPGLVTDWADGMLGQVFTRAQWEAWRAEVDNFFDAVPDEWVEDYNRSRDFDSGEYWKEVTGYYDEPAPKSQSTPKPGFIYLIKSEDGYYKIGRAADMGARFRGIQICLPFKTELIHHFRAIDYIKRERELHEIYADRRMNGEWFRLDQSDVNLFLQLQDEHSEADAPVW